MNLRLLLVAIAYIIIFVVSYAVSFLLRFEFEFNEKVQDLFLNSALIMMTLKICTVAAVGEHLRSFRFATLTDLGWTWLGVSIASILFFVGNEWSLIPVSVPRSVILIDFGISLVLCALLRMGFRICQEFMLKHFQKSSRIREAALVYGVNNLTMQIVRAINDSHSQYQVVGFVENSPKPRSSRPRNLPVYSSFFSWGHPLRKSEAAHVLIPSEVSGTEVRKILEECRLLGVNAHVIPKVEEVVDGKFQLTISKVTISDLLRRPANNLDLESISHYITEQTVMVTGGAGSIGSEICRQILEFKPKSLIVLDQSEFGVFNIEQELKKAKISDVEIHFVLADIVDQIAIDRLMEEHKPDLVFHAAAYKHVPLMEESPHQAVQNNIIGTKNLVDLADKHQVKRFVLISTDKAVRPTSVMGSSKLLAEKYLQGRASCSKTQYITVRFGNVLDSAGSVIPTFRKQLESGGPLTVTDERMVRYFMTIPEAVQLVLQAGAVGESGDILILDMGEPVKIMDLAKDMILLSGLHYPNDIDIEITGIRPGEKLYEELFYGDEKSAQHVHEKILRASPENIDFPLIQAQVQTLAENLQKESEIVLKELQAIVSYYVEQSGRADVTQRAA